MSSMDYQDGLNVGYWTARGARSDLNSWKRHAQSLQVKIEALQKNNQELREKLTLAFASFRTSRFLIDELVRILESAAPAEALADSATRDRLLREKLQELLLRDGYAIDFSTNKLTPKPPTPGMGR